jgi:hypothetical protein
MGALNRELWVVAAGRRTSLLVLPRIIELGEIDVDPAAEPAEALYAAVPR